MTTKGRMLLLTREVSRQVGLLRVVRAGFGFQTCVYSEDGEGRVRLETYTRGNLRLREPDVTNSVM